MNIKYTKYPNGYIKVSELMLPKPKHRSKFVSDGQELIPIVTIEVSI